jgi:hypothetical protein
MTNIGNEKLKIENIDLIIIIKFIEVENLFQAILNYLQVLTSLTSLKFSDLKKIV